MFLVSSHDRSEEREWQLHRFTAIKVKPKRQIGSRAVRHVLPQEHVTLYKCPSGGQFHGLQAVALPKILY